MYQSTSNRSLKWKSVVLLAGLLSLSAVSLSQEAPAWELHGGYQLLRADISDFRNSLNAATDANGIARLNIGDHLNAQGWDGSVQENMNRWFGGIIDVSGSYVKHDINITSQLQDAGLIGPDDKALVRLKPSFYTVAGGPQFTYRHSAIQPFVRIMLGAVNARGRADVRVNQAIFVTSPEESDTAFAVFGGAGVDLQLKSRFAIRVAADYIRSYLFDQTQGNLRVTVGVVYRIGSK